MCVGVCVYVHKRVGALRGQKWVLDVLELGLLQAAVNHLIRMLEVKLQFSARAASDLPYPSTSAALMAVFLLCTHTHDDFIVKNSVFVQLTSNSFYNYCIFIYSFCVHVCVVCVSPRTCLGVWLAEDDSQESVFFFDLVGPGIKLRSPRLAKIH